MNTSKTVVFCAFWWCLRKGDTKTVPDTVAVFPFSFRKEHCGIAVRVLLHCIRFISDRNKRRVEMRER